MRCLKIIFTIRWNPGEAVSIVVRLLIKWGTMATDTVRRIPSTQALRALEAFARHGTVWQAAEEMCLTRSAVSHQLRLLERDLGFALTARSGTRIELTPQGTAFAEDVRRALATISGSARRQAGRGLTGSLTVSCTPGFASAWLSPKIGRFARAAPDVDLSVVTPLRLDDVANPDVDVFVSFGYEPRAGLRSELLREVEFTPLCSPTLMNAYGGLSSPEDLLRAPLLHITDYEDWVRWFTVAGLPVVAARRGIRFTDMNLVYAAAYASQGIAMGDEFICKDALASGLLVRPFDGAISSPASYQLVLREEKADDPAVAAFCAWLRAEVQDF